jgi:predicted TIM-barrel fold metal-dependent hydrolase
MKIIDTHQHLIYPDRFGYAWCKGIPALEGKAFRLEEYREASQGTGIGGTLFMETGVDDPDARSETDFFLALAARPGSGILGVLATCRPEEKDFPARLDAMLHPHLRGLRRILHVVPDAVSQTPLFAANVALLAQHDLTFDLCLLPRQLHLGVALARKCPQVQFVLDHCGVPNVKDGELDPWRGSIRELAALPNVACKVSGVAAYCDPARVTVDALRPFVEHCIECFGWDRVVFGGDWPVCNMTASLGLWVELAKELVSAEPAGRQEKLFADNARRIYRLNE